MRTDGLFSVFDKEIKVEVDKPIYLVPVGDIHHDAQCHANKEFKRFLTYMATERKGNSYCLGMGDYNDFQRAHERAILEGSNSEGMKLAANSFSMREVQRTYEAVKELNWIALLSGNHFTNLDMEMAPGIKGVIHSDKYLADMLGVQYLGVCAAITLKLKAKRVSGEVKLIAHHGIGGGGTIGGGLNRVRKFLQGWNADIGLMGDNHQRGILPTEDTISFGQGELASHTKWVARTGSFLKGYEPNCTNYVTDFALSPTSLGWVEFELRLDKTGMVHIRGIQ